MVIWNFSTFPKSFRNIENNTSEMDINPETLLNNTPKKQNKLPHSRPLGWVIIMRGLPGSGKTTMANLIRTESLQRHGVSPDLVTIVSADDYFVDETGTHKFDGTKLTGAHQKCQADFNDFCKRMEENQTKGIIIVDNTNMQSWEARPYLDMAMKYEYRFEIVEPNTTWKYDIEKCALKTPHKVPLSTISNMWVKYADYNLLDVSISKPPDRNGFSKNTRFSQRKTKRSIRK